MSGDRKSARISVENNRGRVRRQGTQVSTTVLRVLGRYQGVPRRVSWRRVKFKQVHRTALSRMSKCCICDAGVRMIVRQTDYLPRRSEAPCTRSRVGARGYEEDDRPGRIAISALIAATALFCAACPRRRTMDGGPYVHGNITVRELTSFTICTRTGLGSGFRFQAFLGTHAAATTRVRQARVTGDVTRATVTTDGRCLRMRARAARRGIETDGLERERTRCRRERGELGLCERNGQCGRDGGRARERGQGPKRERAPEKMEGARA